MHLLYAPVSGATVYKSHLPAEPFPDRTVELHSSSKSGRFSLIYSTTASGPFSTCNPCGRLNVLIPGMVSRAIPTISCASTLKFHKEINPYNTQILPVLVLVSTWMP